MAKQESSGKRGAGERARGPAHTAKKASPAQRKGEDKAQKIITYLTFDDRAEEAVNFYVSIFRNSRILSSVRSDEEGPVAKGKVLNATFELDGQQFMAMDAGPYFSFANGMSLFVNCETQDEIDDLWERLSEGGEKQPCGWLRDKFGVSWQIIPKVLGEMMTDPESGNSRRVMEELLKMSKIDIKTLKQAYAQRQ